MNEKKQHILTKLDELGINQKELSKKLKVTPVAVSKFLNEKNSLSMENLISLSNILGETLDWIIKGPSDNNKTVDIIKLRVKAGEEVLGLNSINDINKISDEETLKIAMETYFNDNPVYREIIRINELPVGKREKAVKVLESTKEEHRLAFIKKASTLFKPNEIFRKGKSLMHQIYPETKKGGFNNVPTKYHSEGLGDHNFAVYHEEIVMESYDEVYKLASNVKAKLGDEAKELIAVTRNMKFVRVDQNDTFKDLYETGYFKTSNDKESLVNTYVSYTKNIRMKFGDLSKNIKMIEKIISDLISNECNPLRSMGNYNIIEITKQYIDLTDNHIKSYEDKDKEYQKENKDEIKSIKRYNSILNKVIKDINGNVFSDSIDVKELDINKPNSVLTFLESNMNLDKSTNKLNFINESDWNKIFEHNFRSGVPSIGAKQMKITQINKDSKNFGWSWISQYMPNYTCGPKWIVPLGMFDDYKSIKEPVKGGLFSTFKGHSSTSRLELPPLVVVSAILGSNTIDDYLLLVKSDVKRPDEIGQYHNLKSFAKIEHNQQVGRYCYNVRQLAAYEFIKRNEQDKLERILKFMTDKELAAMTLALDSNDTESFKIMMKNGLKPELAGLRKDDISIIFSRLTFNSMN